MLEDYGAELEARGTRVDGVVLAVQGVLVIDRLRRHNGRAWVQDRPGGGARFVVQIPEVTAPCHRAVVGVILLLVTGCGVSTHDEPW